MIGLVVGNFDVLDESGMFFNVLNLVICWVLFDCGCVWVWIVVSEVCV